MSEQRTKTRFSWIIVALLIAAAVAIVGYEFNLASPLGLLRPHQALAAPTAAVRGPWMVDQSPDPVGLPAAPAPLVQLAAMRSQALGPLPTATDQPGAADWIYHNPPALRHLSQLFRQFHHEPFATAGFNPLVLPFRYADPQNCGDPSEAAALSFLLSDALDWGPGNYGRRHAYFVYQRSQEQMAPLETAYDSAAIGQLVREWTASHAVGGLLTRTAAGCAGQLQIFDSTGTQVFHKNYAEPRSYFDLLGDMAVDTLTFMKEPPNTLLAQYLHQPRCQHEESILRLGMARALPQRSDQQLKMFQQILVTDPDFAEVRYWLANEKQYRDWPNYDRHEYQRQLGLSLQSRLTVPALRVFSPAACPDPSLAAHFVDWFAQAQRLVGRDSPLVLTSQLQQVGAHPDADNDLIARALAAAPHYPNDLPLLDTLCYAMKRRDGPLDADLVCSLAVTAWASRYMTPDDRRQPRDVLLWALPLLGMDDLAATLLDPPPTPVTSIQLYDAGNILGQCGRFGDELTYFLSQQNVPHDFNYGLNAAMNAAVAATAANNTQVLRRLTQNWSSEFDLYGLTPLLRGYQSALTGGPVDSNALRQVCLKHLHEPGALDRIILGAQTDVILHRRHFLDLLWDNSCDFPNDRLLWTLLDGYEQQHPTFAGPCFYQSLQWYSPHDPWVQQAVARWQARHDQPPGSDPHSLATSVQAALAAYEPSPSPKFKRAMQLAAMNQLVSAATPWVVTEVIHQMLNRSDVAGAHDLALRYQNLAAQVNEDGLDAWAARLVHRTQAN